MQDWVSTAHTANNNNNNNNNNNFKKKKKMNQFGVLRPVNHYGYIRAIEEEEVVVDDDDVCS